MHTFGASNIVVKLHKKSPLMLIALRSIRYIRIILFDGLGSVCLINDTINSVLYLILLQDTTIFFAYVGSQHFLKSLKRRMTGGARTDLKDSRFRHLAEYFKDIVLRPLV